MTQQRLQPVLTFAERFIALPVFVIVMTYTYIHFFQKPAIGFTWILDGHVSQVYEPGPNGFNLRSGDRLIQIGDVPWSVFEPDLRTPIFENEQPGQVVPIQIERNGEPLTINWIMPGYGPQEFEQRFNNNWWLGYVFLFVGTITLLTARPKDTTWRLFVLFNYLTAIWLTAGSMVSPWHLFEGAIVLRVFVWLCLPVYLHFHWVFPKPLGRLPGWVWPVLYGLGGVLAVLQWFQKLPNASYWLGFLVAVSGSILLLLLHMLLRPADRRQIWPVVAGSLVGFIPPTLLAWVFSLVGQSSTAPLLALFFFPIVPIAYFLAIYRRRLGALELRANRAVAVYLLLSLLGTFVVLSAALVQIATHSEFNAAGVAVIAAVIGLLLGVYVFEPFQQFVERGLLGIQLPPDKLIQASAARIAASLDLPALTTLIRDEITTSLLIRQSALYTTQTATPLLLYSQGQTESLSASQLSTLADSAGGYLSPDSTNGRSTPSSWVRLCLPLVLNHQQIGLWLLGRRDPDDYYSLADIQVLRTLANQAAVALAHIQQTEQLRLLYENDINQRELERASLARELHDNALNELSYFKRLVEPLLTSPELSESYDRVTQAIRRSITELQPAAVNYGLQLALRDLADRANQGKQTNAPAIQIELEEETPGIRFDSFVELHLYRVTQQAIANALQHAQATQIAVRGRIRGDSVQVAVEDNGVGFELNGRSDAARLVLHKHFGLAAMYERAQIIGAQLHIQSKPQQGARIEIVWQPPRAPI